MKMTVQSYRGPYEVEFCTDFLTPLNSTMRDGDVIVLDENVARLHGTRLRCLITDNQVLRIQPTEEAKSYDKIGDVIGQLIEGGFKKNNRLVAIGGGVTQDVTGFAASILYRGVDWFFVPTNLLSQCDSCIGSKTSVNFRNYKNQLGGFHPARLVLIDPGFLTTLGDREFRSGLGEMMHYFLLSGRDDFELIRDCYDESLHDPAVMQELIGRSLEIKKAMIERDEFDKGPRNVFNYGHSFGHALESYTGYAIPHGIAVSFGMDMANRLSWKLGLLSEAGFLEMRHVLRKNWAGMDVGDLDSNRFLSIMARDKKNIDAKLRVILTRGIGQMFIERVTPDALFRGNLEACFDDYKTMAS